MRTETRTITIYKFDELSEEAKEKVVGELREDEMRDFLDELVDCMKSAMNTMGITIKNYSIDIDGSGYIDLLVCDDGLEGIKAYKYITNDLFEYVNKKKFYYKGWEKRRKSNLDSKDWMDNCPFSGMCCDYAVKNAWVNWCSELRKGNSPTVCDFLHELEYQYLHEIANAYHSFDKDDARELAEANDYEFLEDGTIY